MINDFKKNKDRVTGIDKADEIERLKKESQKRYGDIIDRKRPVSVKRNHMSIKDRAAQFAPFAALSGYHESVDETSKTETKLNSTGGIVHEKWYDEGDAVASTTEDN